MNSDKNLFSRNVSMCHIFYILLITVIVNVFLLVICPGRINQDAMDNISFASAIVSIALAVISILYSLQSGLSSSSQFNSIKNIEGNIQSELSKFEKLRESIIASIEPINKTVWEIKKTAGDLSKAQDDIKVNMDVLYRKTTVEVPCGGHKENKELSLSHIMVVTLYAAAKSKETGMDLPFHKFSQFVGMQSHFCEGVLVSLSTFSDGLTVEQGSRSTRKKVKKYDEHVFGCTKELRAKAVGNIDTRLGNEFILSLDNYYSDSKNQIPSDSVS